jgi:glycosyltransferase involved in cell wall biosynthesis
MAPISRLAFIGNSLPRRCGIATFTTDLQQATAARSAARSVIVAMNDQPRAYEYPPVVQFQIDDQERAAYAGAADFLNANDFQIACLQHEFGIFGGEAGGHIVELLSRLSMPIVTTLHTVLEKPEPAQRAVFERIVQASAKVIVMARKGEELLHSMYGAPREKIEVIPHGIPDCPYSEPDAAKARLGYAGRRVILTFGLLSPSKGIEVMIDAMPSILERRPDAVYVVLGATHPNLVRREGEAYRESLAARVRALGVEDHVVFLDQFVDQATLLEFISMCDVYVTPYLNEAQMTSGTLAYSFGLGKAVVSTPYWHARELLAGEHGVLVPFGDSRAIGVAITGLLTDDTMRQSMRRRAYASSRSMTWERTAERYLATFEKVRREQRLRVVASQSDSAPRSQSQSPPPMQIGHLLAMCDDTGLLQHAIHAVPDRAHGYCVDDNARALLVACALNAPTEQRMPETLIMRLAAFVQHAWNPDTRRFRNFMSFDRRWLEETGSEDCHGRALWALGECARSDANASRRRWATALFREALPATAAFRSPRAWAFALLGLDAYCSLPSHDSRARELRHELADRLMSLLKAVATPDWIWFEEVLAYENARLPQALIATGLSTGVLGYATAGLRSLRWLMTLQTTETGLFRPVGSASFGAQRVAPQQFDQQPLEAAATISACLAALHADGDPEWKAGAQRAFAWFLGGNDLATPLVDSDTGGCRDGLHPERVNENRGGESAVSYLLGLADMRALARSSGNRASLSPLRILHG